MSRRALPVLLALAGFASADDAHAYCRMTTSTAAPATPTSCITEGIPLAWKRRCMSYSIDMHGTPDLPIASVQSIVASSFAAWTEASCSYGVTGLTVRETATLANCEDAEYRSNDGNVNVIAFVGDWPDRMYDPSAYAVTTVWHNTDTGEIYDADMLINQRLAPYGICPSTGCTLSGGSTTVDLQEVVTHEAGHFFGLSHSAVGDATMYYLAPRGEVSKRSLAPDDVAGLCAIYPQGSLASTCDYTPRHGLDVDCVHEPSSRGRGCAAAPTGEPNAFLGAFGAAVLAVIARRRRARAA